MKNWHFSEIDTADSPRNPHDDVYFKGTDKSEAIVREFIQNALDAKREDSDKVKVKITLGRDNTEKIGDFISNLDKHLEWSGYDTESYHDRFYRYMIVEDFGTTGLTGEYIKKRVNKDTSSNFYSFWWEEGLSGKEGSKGSRGSWGLGKTTNHMASDIYSFWGLTVRQDDSKELLMGKSMLKPHWGGETHYNYGGRFMNEDGSPIKQEDIIEEFKNKFPVTRESQEPGFSVTIPFLDPKIKHDKIVKSAIIHYTFAIMLEDLVVEVIKKGDGEDEKITINSDNIEKIASKYDWNDLSWKHKNVMDTLAFCRESANSYERQDYISVYNIRDINEIKNKDFFSKFKSDFNKGKLVSINIPVKIQPKVREEVEETFSIFLKKYPDENVNPDEFYVREGMLLPDESNAGLANRSVRGILLANNEEISNFLAGAEEPAHEKWNERMDKYKEEYKEATATLRFIRNSMSDIINLIDETDEIRLEGVLDDVFSIPKDLEEKNQEVEGGDESEEDEGKGNSGPEEIETDRSPKVKTVRTENGFKIEAVSDKDDYPQERRVRMAYDTGSSNPFEDHEPYDFNLDEGDLKIETRKTETIDKGANWIKFRILGPKSFIKIEGFDTNRDLRVSL